MLGQLFTTDGNDVWDVVAVCPDQTMTIHNLRNGQRINTEPCGELMSKMKRLVPQASRSMKRSDGGFDVE
jgi:hypothetical protein